MADSSSSPPGGRVAGIDFGTVRIGVALTDRQRTLATPHVNYTRVAPAADARYFCDLVKEEEITLFVVGLPVHLDGRESGKSGQARQFGEWLSETTGVEVAYFDERFTTAEAEDLLQQGGLTKDQKKARLDMLSAQLMLSAWLEAESPTDAPRGLDD